jgi:hypothetical protein
MVIAWYIYYCLKMTERGWAENRKTIGNFYLDMYNFHFL